MRRYLLSAVATSLLVAPAAVAQGPTDGTITLTPSRIEVPSSTKVSPPVELSNESDKAIAVEVAILPATQQRNGQPLATDSPASRRLGQSLFALRGPRSFRLKPGQKRSVRVEVRSCPQLGQGTYGLLAFITRLADQSEGKRARISTSVRLSSPLLFAHPAGTCFDGEVLSLAAEQTSSKPPGLNFIASVRNLGNLHTEPRLTLIISRDGRTIYQESYLEGNVLPHAVRDYNLQMKKKVLPAGNYQARVSTDIGKHHSKAVHAFRLIGPNQLPTPKLVIDAIRELNPQPGADISTSAKIRNVGTAPAGGTVDIELTASGNSRVLESDQIKLPPVAPKDVSPVQVNLNGRQKGRYQLKVTVSREGRPVAEELTSVIVREGPPNSKKASDWMENHIRQIAAGALGLLGLLIVGGLIVIVIRRRRSDQTPPGV